MCSEKGNPSLRPIPDGTFKRIVQDYHDVAPVGQRSERGVTWARVALDRLTPRGVSLQSIRSVKAAMANTPVDPKEAHAAAIADVKQLMRLARTGALA